MKYSLFFLSVLFSSMTLSASMHTGDTQGKVLSIVVLHNHGKTYNSFRIYLKDTDNDRFGCVENDGYVTVRTSGIGVDETNYEQMYSMAMTAQVTGATLALSHSGSDPCINVNGTFMVM